MSEQKASGVDLHALENDYEIQGELRGTESARYYIGRTKQDPPAEVAIIVVRAPGSGQSNALTHLGSDVQILADRPHPSLVQVIGGHWLGNDAYAIVTERVIGETLSELLERGEKFGNARAAMLLQEISGALDWAREHGVVHRGVTPDSLTIERDTNRIHVAFTPTPIPITGVPDASGDARTLGLLAWALLTGAPAAEGETRSLGEVCPNLATRVVESTDKMIRSKDHRDAPDIPSFIGVVAAGDALKQAEVELSAQKEEYDEQHRAALQACEVQRQEVEQHASEQASMLAGEREEFERKIAEERAAIEAERVTFETMMAERKDRFAAVRAELDEQRVELERRLAELESYRTDVEKLRDEAIAAREEAHAAAKTAAAKAEEFNAATAAANAAANAANAAHAADVANAPAHAPVAPLPIVPVMDVLEPHPRPELAKPPKAPKWSKIDKVDLDSTDITELPQGRPRWMIPAGVATLVLILVAVIIGVTHRTPSPEAAVKVGSTTIRPTVTPPPRGTVPAGGFLSQSAGGALASKFVGSPLVNGATAPATPPGSVVPLPADTTHVRTQAEQDSIAAAAAARAKRAAARAEARRRAAADSAATANASNPIFAIPPRPDSLRRDSVKRDTVRRDTVVKRDTIKPPTDTAGRP